MNGDPRVRLYAPLVAGLAHAALGHHAEAMAAYAQCLARGPNCAQAWEAQGAEAHRVGASDIHVEPSAGLKDTTVRLRVDGTCFTSMPAAVMDTVWTAGVAGAGVLTCCPKAAAEARIIEAIRRDLVMSVYLGEMGLPWGS